MIVPSVYGWYSLGLALGLDEYELNGIRIRERSSGRQKAMISLWLDTGNASWRALVRALASPLVGNRGLAMKIAAEHGNCM